MRSVRGLSCTSVLRASPKKARVDGYFSWLNNPMNAATPKFLAIRMIILALRVYYRRFPITIGKKFIWNRVVLPLCRRAATTTARTTFGSIMRIDLRDIIQRIIFFFNIFEPEITEYVKHALSPGDIFIDIGANVGYYSLLAGKLVGSTGKVFAFEASPRIFAMLQDNLKLNNMCNVLAKNVAITETPGHVAVYIGDGENLGATTIIPEVASRGMTEIEAIVPGLPLSDALSPELIQRARLIKIDVEGAEWDVLQGLRKLLPRLSERTEFIVEIDHLALSERGVDVIEFLRMFQSVGLAPFIVPNEYGVRFYLDRRRRALRPVANWEDCSSELGGREIGDLIFRRCSRTTARAERCAPPGSFRDVRLCS
jgi:FkbM family methyltransferase